jgi:hypothetical protein
MQSNASGSGASRFCPTCRTDVQDVGGFCLLGHSLRLTASTKSLGELRSEVARTFDEATTEVSRVFGDGEESPAAPMDPTGPPSPPSRPPAPPMPPGQPPPPPPPADVPSAPARDPAESPEDDFLRRSATIWRTLADDVPPPESDPITAFAPPPRMDWGPSRPFLRRPSSVKRLKPQDAAAG